MKLRGFAISIVAIGLLSASSCKKEETTDEQSDPPAAKKEEAAEQKPAAKKDEPKEESPAPKKTTEQPSGTVPAAVQTFHDFFRPIWQIEDKKARMAKFCEQADKALEVTDALEGLKPPEGVSAKAWAQALFELSTHIADSDRACASDKKNFEKYFLGANDSLDALMALTKPGHQGH